MARTKLIAIRHGEIAGIRSGAEINKAVFPINGARITHFGAGVPLQGPAIVIDPRRETVFSELIDTHKHLAYHHDKQI